MDPGRWKIVFLLGKLFRLFSPQREDLESSGIPALMVRSKGPAARAVGDACFVLSSSILGTRGRKINGICQLPQGYALSIVSPETQVIGLDQDQHNRKSTGTSCYSHLMTTLSSKWLQRQPPSSSGDPAPCPMALSSKIQLAEIPHCYPPDALCVSYSLPGAG